VVDIDFMATIPDPIPGRSKSRISKPKKPFAGFPLFAHPNGQWAKKVNAKPYYFGSWSDDPKGESAIQDWLTRKDAILAGLDSLRVASVQRGMTLGDLMGRFLKDRHTRVKAGDLALTTYGDYLKHCQEFTAAIGKDAVVASLMPAHFQAYADRLVKRGMSRHSRKRIIAYTKAMLNWGATNGYYPRPTYGTAFVAPDCSPEAIRQAKMRAGEKDYSGRIVTGDEMTQLLNRASSRMKACILIAVNCGLGPADIGRLRWHQINMVEGFADLPRGKTGVRRIGYLWKRTRRAIEHVATLKQNAAALKKHGQDALVFVNRVGKPMYAESEIGVNGKSVGVKRDNLITPAFGDLARKLKLEGVSFYRLRHTFKTLGKQAKDRDALNLMMGHKEPGIGRIYDHEEISFDRIKRVALVVKSALWPKPDGKKKHRQKPASLKPGQMRMAV
jgi:integrase